MPAALCAGVAGDGVTGSNTDAATCMSAKEAMALNKIWYGAHCRTAASTPPRTPDSRSGKSLGAKQLWWTFTKGTAIGGQITSAAHRYRSLWRCRTSATPPMPARRRPSRSPTVRRSVRNKWLELDYAGLADAREQARRAAADAVQQPHHRQGRICESCATSAAR